MTRRDWWLGIAVLTAAIVFHAAVPRYTWREIVGNAGVAFVRADRWTGAAMVRKRDGTWFPLQPQ